MKNAPVVVIVSTICLVGSLLLVRAGPEKRDAPETAELAKAVAMTTAKLQATVKSPAGYKLIKVELTWIEGKYAWRTTYKPSRLLPENPAKEAIGAGGEVFITVDLKNGQTEVRHGE
jgi:hypothetical protein